MIHRRNQHQGRGGRQRQRRQEIVTQAGSKSRHQVGGGWRYQDQVGPARELDMIHARLGSRVEQILSN
jgi:hypothetical protein